MDNNVKREELTQERLKELFTYVSAQVSLQRKVQVNKQAVPIVAILEQALTTKNCNYAPSIIPI